MATPRWWSASLPDDIIENILTWLPPKPLVRFRCVRQSWNSKISDPEFINKHLSMNKAKSLSLYDDNNNNNGYLLCRSPRPVHDLRLVMVRELCTFVCNTNSDGSLTEISRLRINPIYHDSSFGFCNGICYGTITVSHPSPWNFCGTSYQWHFSKTRSPAYIRLEMLEYTCGTQALESIRDFQLFSMMTVFIIALMDLRFPLSKQ